MAIRSPYQMMQAPQVSPMASGAQVIQEQGGGGLGGALGAVGTKLAGKAINKGLTSALGAATGSAALGPLAPFAGLFLNKGGVVEEDNWKKLQNSVKGYLGRNDGGMVWQGFNMGGMSKHPNPMGYNEGGAVGETPIKKVMDEQKLEQQAVAFELEQERKQQTHEQAMRIKEKQAAQAAKMKQASATTNKTPTKPKGPLAGKK